MDLKVEKIRDRVRAFLPEELPRGSEVIKEGIELAKGIKIGQSLFLEENRVSSELEFKKKMMQERRVTFNMQYGLPDFEQSIRGLEYIYTDCANRGAEVTRFGICLDRAMGLPSEIRDKVPRESGLFIEKKEGWNRLARTVPVQPHFGDNMIGSPASLENTINALEAGATTIGNFSHFFSYQYPFWNNTALWAENALKAVAIMAGKREQGALMHSNVDDGISAYFTDTCSLIAWAMFEHYIIEELVGAKSGPAFGNLVDNPLQRMAILLALDAMHQGDLVGSMLIGNTISAVEDLDRNFASVAGYALYDMVFQMEHPTGHAIQPLPVTEMLRIPTPQENAQIQVFGNQLLREAEKIYEHGLVNFDPAYKLKEKLLAKGRASYENFMEFLNNVVDIKDPLCLMLAVKSIDPISVEKIFTGSLTGSSAQYVPQIPRGMYAKISDYIEDENKRIDIENLENAGLIKGSKVLVAATDIHEFGKAVIAGVLEDCGVNVTDAGTVTNPYDLVTATVSQLPDALIVSTHNGGALSYGKSLMEGLKEYSLDIPVFMGGRLNEMTGEQVPVDVTHEVREIGINTATTPEELVKKMVFTNGVQ